MAINWDDTALRERVRKAAMRGVVRATEAVRTEAISLILNTPKTGRTYYRGNVEHVASAPGEPPASDTGKLVHSINAVYDFAQLRGTLNVSVDYGLFLEFGTAKVEPRPFLRPAIANKGRDIGAIIQDEIQRELAK